MTRIATTNVQIAIINSQRSFFSVHYFSSSWHEAEVGSTSLFAYNSLKAMGSSHIVMETPPLLGVTVSKNGLQIGKQGKFPQIVCLIVT